jgi:hypothetical protein
MRVLLACPHIKEVKASEYGSIPSVFVSVSWEVIRNCLTVEENEVPRAPKDSAEDR